LTGLDGAGLLALARRAIDAALAGCPAPAIPQAPWTMLRRGAFVTLLEHESGELRGCIGHVWGDQPLGEVIRQVAVSAARADPRFPPVQPHELPELRLEVSVLAEPVRVDAAALCGLVIGRDGLLVRRGRAQAVLLPQVATEQGFDAERFLQAVCHKAGLPPGSWREPATQVFTFTADVFLE
jgi:AmmeMemoRadiSam system protein A